MIFFLTRISSSWAVPSQKWFHEYKAKELITTKPSPYPVISDHFIQTLQDVVPQRTLAFFSSQLTSHMKNCKESYVLQHSSDFPLPSQNETEKLFTQSLFAIETIHCIPNRTPEEVRQQYHSTEFRIDIMPGVSSFSMQALTEIDIPQTKRQISCTTTEGMTGITLPSSYCMEHLMWSDPNTSTFVELASLYSNNRSTELQPIYFRQESLLFSKYNGTQGKGTVIYRYTLTRSMDLGRTSIFFLDKTLYYSHHRIREGLLLSP